MDPRLIQVTGMNQCGKSTLVKELLEGKDGVVRDRAIIVQPFSKNDYNAHTVASIDKCAELLRDVRPKTFRLKLWLQDNKELAKLCRLAWAIAPVTLVLDETTMYIPNPREVPPEFKYVCQLGAHAGADERQKVSVIAIGQRPTNLPPVFRAEVEHWYLFRLNGRRDRALLEADMGLAREVADKAGQLPRYHYMRADVFSGVQYGQTSR